MYVEIHLAVNLGVIILLRGGVGHLSVDHSPCCGQHINSAFRQPVLKFNLGRCGICRQIESW
jgi:hypothetical protein